MSLNSMLAQSVKWIVIISAAVIGFEMLKKKFEQVKAKKAESKKEEN